MFGFNGYLLNYSYYLTSSKLFMSIVISSSNYFKLATDLRILGLFYTADNVSRFVFSFLFSII